MLTVKILDDMIPNAFFTVLAVNNGDKPQIGISLTRLLIITDLRYLPQNMCFWWWGILMNKLEVAFSPMKASKYQIASNHTQ